MIEQWRELKETITEMRDNGGAGSQQEVCKFLANLMDVLEKQVQEPMRDATEEECKSVKDYVESISKPTGFNFYETQLCEDCVSIKPKLYKAKIKNTDKYVTGAYYCYPKTTYCFTEDYNKFPVEDEHIIITHHMTDWGLPNEIRAYKIDVNTLEEI